MGIMAPVARFILKEHKRKPIVGRAAFIGRQTIPAPGIYEPGHRDGPHQGADRADTTPS